MLAKNLCKNSENSLRSNQNIFILWFRWNKHDLEEVDPEVCRSWKPFRSEVMLDSIIRLEFRRRKNYTNRRDWTQRMKIIAYICLSNISLFRFPHSDFFSPRNRTRNANLYLSLKSELKFLPVFGRLNLFSCSILLFVCFYFGKL